MDAGSPRGLTGLDFLQRYRRWDSLLAADRASWDKWSTRQHAELWVAMALHVGLDPDSLEANGESAVRTMDSYRSKNEVDQSDPFDQYLRALDLAVRALASGKFPPLATNEDPRRSLVRFDAVADWACQHVSVIDGWPPADTWLELRQAQHETLIQSGARPSAATGRDHAAGCNGSLIQRMLDFAARHRADAAARGEFVTNIELEALLKAKFPDSSAGAREAIATDTRPKDQRKGRPRKR